MLVALLAMDVSIFGSDAILGASQISLLLASGICIWLSMWLHRTPWKDFEMAIKSNIGDVTTAIVILFMIGAISGTWMMSGVIPTLICYGVKIISPKVFLVTACVISALVSVTIGSSWTTIATIGVALLGIGRALGFSDGLTAGAIISGAYFGDKISPLSDTTVLASSMGGVPLFRHIRNMTITTVPTFVITILIFLVLGFLHKGADEGMITAYSTVLQSRFHISLWLLAVPLLTALMIARRMPALVVLALSVLTASVAALILQLPVLMEIGSAVTEGSRFRLIFSGLVKTIYDTVSLETGNAQVNALVATRGMTGMLNTVYLIICAMCFGASMQASGMLRQITDILLPLGRSRTGLVALTAGSGTVLNGLVSDQYLAIILTSNLYREAYAKRNYPPELMTRSVEDSATVTSVLFPWSSCGMTQATILGVSTLAYAPFCFFNWLSPLMSIIMAWAGYKLPREAVGSGRD